MKNIKWCMPKPIGKKSNCDLNVTQAVVDKHSYLFLSFKKEICDLFDGDYLKAGFDVEHNLILIKKDEFGFKTIKRNTGKRQYIRISERYTGAENRHKILGMYVFLSEEDGVYVFEKVSEE